MSAQPVKHFELYFDGHKCLAVHRLDELLQVTFTHGPGDLAPDVVFLAPTAAAALADAIAAAARDAAAVFNATHRSAPPPRKRLPAWGPAFAFGGLPYTLCPAGDGRIGPGQSTRAETATGRLWHDDCAEDAGAGERRPDRSAASRQEVRT